MPGCTSSVLGAGLAIDVGVEHFWCSNVLGNVVHVQLVKQDWAKVDLGNLTGIVVIINDVFGVCQVALRSGVLRPWYVYHKLRVVPGPGNSYALMNLDDAFKRWKGMPVIALRTAAVNESIVGGQGIFQCKCKGACNTKQNLCFKNNRKCMSSCHRNSKCCLNHDWENLDASKARIGDDNTAKPPAKWMKTCRAAD